jgi:hypothetical protein
MVGHSLGHKEPYRKPSEKRATAGKDRIVVRSRHVRALTRVASPQVFAKTRAKRWNLLLVICDRNPHIAGVTIDGRWLGLSSWRLGWPIVKAKEGKYRMNSPTWTGLFRTRLAQGGVGLFEFATAKQAHGMD